MIDANDADLALADAHWWLKGFHAATCSDRADDAFEAMTRLGRVRDWLQALLAGDAVLINADVEDRQGFRIVITEAQLEGLTDGLRETASAEDLTAARLVRDDIWERAKRERAAARNPTIPF